MPNWNKKRVLITVRTYPVPAASTTEASCTGGVSDGKWIRLFPVPYRFLDDDQRFSKWHWIDVEVTKPTSDARPESFKIKPDSIEIIGDVGTSREWRDRRVALKPLIRPSMCAIRRERDERGAPTLGLFKPAEITGLTIEQTSDQWTPAELRILRQDTLFQKAPSATLEKIPFNFKYEFRCSDTTCKGHEMTCTDWEMGQAYRAWRQKHGADWQTPFRQKFEADMKQKFDTHFFVGTVHRHPGNWIIVGLFYPPFQTTRDLFC